MRHVLADLLCDQITHEPAIGFNGSGKPIYGPAVVRPARVARKQRTGIGKSGEIAISHSQVWFAALVAVSFSDRITLPGESTPAKVIAVDTLPDDAGSLFTKVFL